MCRAGGGCGSCWPTLEQFLAFVEPPAYGRRRAS
jgi:NAD(P)H-nitrite reductase large subunit